MRMRLAVAGAMLGALVHPGAAGLPSIHELLVTHFQFDRRQVQEIERQRPIAVSLPGAIDREILAAGAVRIEAPLERVLALFRDIERLESGRGFLATVRLNDPPRLEDFSALTLPREDVEDLRRCQPGDCDVKLNQRGFELLAQVDFGAVDADRQTQRFARQMLYEIARDYRTRGNAGLGLSMDDEPHRETAVEFGELMHGKAFLDVGTPGLARYLLDYPHGRKPAGLEEFLYWSLVEFGLKKTIRLNHVVLYPVEGSGGSRWVLSNRIVYASHYFQNAIEVRLLVDDPARPDRAHYLLVLNLARPDGVGGVFGPIVRYKVRSGSRETLRKTLLITKDKAEGTRG